VAGKTGAAEAAVCVGTRVSTAAVQRTALVDVCTSHDRQRYDTIRDDILTCAQKRTQVGLIYRTDQCLF